MYIANNTEQSISEGVIEFIPHALRKYFYGMDISQAYEIHLCPGKPLAVYYPENRKFVSRTGTLTDNPYDAVRVTEAHINEAMELASKSSVYSVEDEIRSGYITVDGGHRIGICGSAVIRGGQIAFVKDISAMNYRIAREIRGAADSVIGAVTSGKTVHSTLIISPPGAGKTTMLRDIVRQLSDSGVRVCVVDERCEIAAMRGGRTGFDLGGSTSVLSGAPKAAGMIMMLRAMSPDVIVTDEIGTGADAKAVSKIINSGTRLITSIHGSSLEQVRRRKDIRQAIDSFEVYITLSKSSGAGTVEEIIT